MKKIFFTIIFAVILFSVNFLPVFAYSFATDSGLDKTAEGTGHKSLTIFNSNSPAQVAGSIIQIVLTFLGVIFLVLMIYAGFIWMLAQGNDQQVDKAKSIIKNSIIGIIIVLMAYAITYIFQTFITKSLI